MTRRIDESKRRIARVVRCVGVLTIVLDTAISNVALSSVRTELHFAEASLVWAVNAYMLTFSKGRRRRRSDQRPLPLRPATR
jgi:2-iminoacetate synthase ThiH